MSGKGEAAKSGQQGGVVDSVKQAGESVKKAVSSKTGGSQVMSNVLSYVVCNCYRDIAKRVAKQVGDVVQEQSSGDAKKVAKE